MNGTPLPSFNSLMVRLVAELLTNASGTIVVFQFLDGAIGRQNKSDIYEVQTCFNSLMVRLVVPTQ